MVRFRGPDLRIGIVHAIRAEMEGARKSGQIPRKHARYSSSRRILHESWMICGTRYGLIGERLNVFSGNGLVGLCDNYVCGPLLQL